MNSVRHSLCALRVDCLLVWMIFSGAEAMAAAGLRLTSPLDYQVQQRNLANSGPVPIAGTLSSANVAGLTLEVRVLGSAQSEEWKKLASLTAGQTEFHSSATLPAGGWYRMEVRARHEAEILSETSVAHVGVGEVFVVAGQSNSANHGEEKQASLTGLVSTFSGTQWLVSSDPQPGASGTGGSFIPPFGDAMATRFKVPIGILAVGVGATSVREWLPKGTRFPNPPTMVGNVRALPSGEWECTGGLFDNLVARSRTLGAHGFRAILWHQGESDANQQDPTRTLSGLNYEKLLGQLIQETQKSVGWEMPWFVAQVSYHIPSDTGSREIRAAQAAVWKSGLGLEGPDSDALTGDLRDTGGQGVHFSGKGLRAHAARWVEKVSPWLEKQLAR